MESLWFFHKKLSNLKTKFCGVFCFLFFFYHPVVYTWYPYKNDKSQCHLKKDPASDVSHCTATTQDVYYWSDMTSKKSILRLVCTLTGCLVFLDTLRCIQITLTMSKFWTNSSSHVITAEPNMGLFVLILMHFQHWFYIWTQRFENLEIFENVWKKYEDLLFWKMSAKVRI